MGDSKNNLEDFMLERLTDLESRDRDKAERIKRLEVIAEQQVINEIKRDENDKKRDEKLDIILKAMENMKKEQNTNTTNISVIKSNWKMILTVFSLGISVALLAVQIMDFIKV